MLWIDGCCTSSFLAAASCDTKTRVYILGGQNRQTEHSRKIMLPTVPTITVLPDVSWSIMPQNMISYLKTESLLMILLDKSPKPTRNKTPKVTAGAANPPQEQMNQTCNCKESISTLRSVSISQKAFYVFRNAYTCSIPSSDSVN